MPRPHTSLIAALILSLFSIGSPNVRAQGAVSADTPVPASAISSMLDVESFSPGFRASERSLADDPLLTDPVITSNRLTNLANAYDGNTASLATFTGGCPCLGSELTLDYGSLKNVTQVRVFMGDAFFSGRIDYSLDGSRWWTAQSIAPPSSVWQVYDVTFTARYVRLYQSANAGWNLGEIAVYGAEYVAGSPGGLPGAVSGSLQDAAYTRDGNVSTQAYVPGCPCIGSHVTLDLGGLKNITQLKLYFTGGSFSGQIVFSLDGSRWWTAQSLTPAMGTWQTYAVSFTARYVRIAQGLNSGWMISEMEVYGADYAAGEPGGAPGAISSNMQDYAYVRDGNTSTRAYAPGCPCIGTYVTLDLGSVASVNRVKAYFTDTGFNGRMDYSVDGSGWATAVSSITSPSEAWQVWDVSFEARYVRLYQAANAGWSLSEFEVYIPQTTSPITLSITDSLGGPLPSNILSLNSIGRLDPITVTLTANNTSNSFQPVSFNLGAAAGIAQFTATPDVSAVGCLPGTVTLTLYIASCDVPPGQSLLKWFIQFHPSDADPAVTISGQIGSQTTSATLSVPKADRPDALYAGDYGPYGVGESEYRFAAGVDPDVDPTSTITTEIWTRVWWPVDQLSGLMPPGRLPLIVMMHGRHSTCRFDFLNLHAETNDYAYTGTCLTRDLQGNPSPVGIPFSVLPNHEGYEYLAERLASWGYLVVSVNTNRGVNIPDRTLTTPGDRAQILARGRLLLKHLQLWQAWDATGTTPAEFGSLISADSMIGNRFQGKVDFDNVGLLGHSRGGEGVRAAYYLYQNDPQVDWLSRLPNLSIQGIFEIGPTDYGPELQDDDLPPLDASGTAWNVILPMCDGDMYMLPGERPFDRMMANLRVESPTTQKSVFAVWGANHNPYNTQWFRVTDLYKVVNGVGVNIDCTGDPANVLLNSGDQRETAIASVLAFFRGNVFSPAVKDNLFGADDPAFDATFNETFNPLFDETSASAITLLERSFTYSSALVVDIIEDFGNSTGFSSSGAANDASNIQIVHGSVPEHDASLQAGIIAWPVDANVSGINTYFQTNLATPQDARSFVSLDFRVARQDSLLNTLGTSTNFSIQLVDSSGAYSEPVELQTYTNLLGPVGVVGYDDSGRQMLYALHSILQTVRIPLADFAGINLVAVQGVRLTFDRTTTGAIYVANVRWSAEP